jgi:hypothetical protein
MIGVLKVLGWILTLSPLIAIGHQWVKSIDAQHYVPMPAGQFWYDLSPGSLNFAQAVIQRYTLPEIWDPFIITLLALPAWLVFLVPGVTLLFIAKMLQSRED